MQAKIMVVTPEPVDDFGRAITAVLGRLLASELVGVYFVGSIALGGYVAGESDVDVVAICATELPVTRRSVIAAAIADAAMECPARGLELTLYRRSVAARASSDAGFELNANGGPRMDRLIRLSPNGQPWFWYALDRAIAHRHGITISGPPAAAVFADLPRHTLLNAMQSSMRWHREHERATLYSVLNAARAWRFAHDDVLGSKLEGAAWARSRWSEPQVLEAAVELRHGRPGELNELQVRSLLDHVDGQITNALALDTQP